MDEPNTREEDVSKMLLVERWSQDHNRCSTLTGDPETIRSKKKGTGTGSFYFSLLLLCRIRDEKKKKLGSGIRTPGSGVKKNVGSGSRINILDPQHWIGRKKKVINLVEYGTYLFKFLHL
jgi:hypothetical protein